MEKSIKVTLDELYADKKTRNFLNHLVRAYMPTTKVEKVLETPKTGNLRCALSGDDLISVSEIIEGIHSEEFKNSFMESLKTMFNEDVKTELPIAKVLDGKKLGLTGKDTTTYMSYEAFQEFYNWVIGKLLSGDKHISWLLGDINRKEFIGKANGNTSKTKPVFKKKEPEFRTATFSLGDMSSLQELKKKLDK